LLFDRCGHGAQRSAMPLITPVDCRSDVGAHCTYEYPRFKYRYPVPRLSTSTRTCRHHQHHQPPARQLNLEEPHTTDFNKEPGPPTLAHPIRELARHREIDFASTERSASEKEKKIRLGRGKWTAVCLVGIPFVKHRRSTGQSAGCTNCQCPVL
jgi:hypothetical protein